MGAVPPAGGSACPRYALSLRSRLNGPRGLGGCHVIAAYILIQTGPGKAATVAAALRGLPGVVEAASLAGPYDVIARAQAREIDELAKLISSRVQALDGVRRTMTCPVVHL